MEIADYDDTIQENHVPTYVVKQGDCVDSIAAEHGLPPDTLWSHANNELLRSLRRDRNVLLPGDKIFVPKPRKRLENAVTTHHHRFVVSRPHTTLCIVFEDENGTPRAGVRYRLEIDGVMSNGHTDDFGQVKSRIPALARKGDLILFPTEEEGQKEHYDLQLGCLDPEKEVTGIQARLANLGYYSGSVDDDFGSLTEAAVSAFQIENQLSVTGKVDAETTQSIKKRHD